MQHPALAGGLGAIIAVVLAAKSLVHRRQRHPGGKLLENALPFAGATLVVLPLVPNCPWAPTVHSIIMRLGCRHTNHSYQRAGLDFLSRHWFQASFRVQRYPASGFTSFC